MSAPWNSLSCKEVWPTSCHSHGLQIQWMSKGRCEDQAILAHFRQYLFQRNWLLGWPRLQCSTISHHTADFLTFSQWFLPIKILYSKLSASASRELRLSQWNNYWKHLIALGQEEHRKESEFIRVLVIQGDPLQSREQDLQGAQVTSCWAELKWGTANLRATSQISWGCRYFSARMKVVLKSQQNWSPKQTQPEWMAPAKMTESNF